MSNINMLLSSQKVLLRSTGLNLDQSLKNAGSGPKFPEMKVLPLIVMGT